MTHEATSPPGPSSGAPPEGGAKIDPVAAGGDTAKLEPSAPNAADDAAPRRADQPGEPPYRPSYLFLAVVSLLALAADLGTKLWAKARLEDARSYGEGHIEVIPKFLKLIFAHNKGGAWGLLGDQPEAIRRPFFLGISAVAILFIVSLYRRLTPQQTALKWGLPFVLGGALGNLINRIQYNYVVDFIDVYVTSGDKEHHWPTFNVADIAICVGVGLMAVDMFTSRRTAPRPEGT
jgi:signal peptidase II